MIILLILFVGTHEVKHSPYLCASSAMVEVSSLPFTHESEPLLVVFECNRHLSLHAGMLCKFEGKRTIQRQPPYEM